jgi:steroid delta-isomerase-like uncharacterized protein
MQSSMSESAATTRAAVEEIKTRREQAFHARDAEALAADYADECVVESPMAGTLEGRLAVEAAYRDLFNAFPDLDFRHDEMIVEGDRVAILWSMHGSHLGELFGFGPTGRSIELNGALIITLSDGKIVRERRIYDFMGLLIQMGALKAKPAY